MSAMLQKVVVLSEKVGDVQRRGWDDWEMTALSTVGDLTTTA